MGARRQFSREYELEAVRLVTERGSRWRGLRPAGAAGCYLEVAVPRRSGRSRRRVSAPA